MFKKRYFSPGSDFKTSIFFKLFLFLGFLFLLIFIFFKSIPFIVNVNDSDFAGELYKLSQSTIPDSILSFSIIFFAVAIILYFFHCQFIKLEKIADEIEKSEEFDDTDFQ